MTKCKRPDVVQLEDITEEMILSELAALGARDRDLDLPELTDADLAALDDDTSDDVLNEILMQSLAELEARGE